MKKARHVVVWLITLAFIFAARTHAALIVDFDQDSYALAQGQNFDVQVHLDADDATPGMQPLPEQLFSFGFKMNFDSTKVSVESVEVVPELDFFLFGPGAQISVDAGVASVKGNVALGTSDYIGTLLATLTLTDLAPEPYSLTLADNKSSPTDDVFVDGANTTRDDEITFGSSAVHVVPEASTAGPAGLAILSLLRHLPVKGPPKRPPIG
jgi:hypothetical protein